MARTPILSPYTIRQIELEDALALQTLLESDPAYFETIQGTPPGPAEAQSLVTAIPDGKSYDDKFVYGVFVDDGVLVAVVDLVRGYPEAATWFLGLVFVAPARRNNGLGTQVIGAIEDHIRRNGGTKLRMACAAANGRALALCDRLGFVLIDERMRETSSGFRLALHVLEKRL